MQTLKPEDFEPWVGRAVRVATVPEPVELVLARVQRHAALPTFDVREPFTLWFEAPMEVFLIDETYEFDCGRGGPYAISISQKEPSQGRRLYEAFFN